MSGERHSSVGEKKNNNNKYQSTILLLKERAHKHTNKLESNL